MAQGITMAPGNNMNSFVIISLQFLTGTLAALPKISVQLDGEVKVCEFSKYMYLFY